MSAGGGEVEADNGLLVGEGDRGHEGVQKAALVGQGLLGFIALELAEHEFQLVAGEAGRNRRIRDGGETDADGGFLLLKFLQALDKAGAAAVFQRGEKVGLLMENLGKIGFQRLLFGVWLWGGLMRLQVKHLIENLLQLVRGKDVLRGGADDGTFKGRFFYVAFGAALFLSMAGAGIITVLFAAVAGAADPFHGTAAGGAEKLAGEDIVGAGAGAAAVGTVEGKLTLAAVKQIAVDHGGDTSLDADIGVLINTQIHLVGDDAQDGILIEGVAARGADPVGVEVGNDIGGGEPGGVLLEDVAHGGGLLRVDAVVLVRPNIVAEAAITAQRNALHGAFALATAQLLGELGAVILGKGFHQAFQNDPLGTVHNGLRCIQDLDAVFAQTVFIDGTIIAVAGKTVGLPADDGIKGMVVTVRDHLLEGGTIVCFAGDVPVDVFLCDGEAVAAGVGLAVVALPLDALLVLAAAAGITVIGNQTHRGAGCGFFAGHEITLLSVARLPGVWYTIHGRRIISLMCCCIPSGGCSYQHPDILFCVMRFERLTRCTARATIKGQRCAG